MFETNQYNKLFGIATNKKSDDVLSFKETTAETIREKKSQLNSTDMSIDLNKKQLDRKESQSQDKFDTGLIFIPSFNYEFINIYLFMY